MKRKAPAQHPTDEEVGQHGISKFKGIEVGLGKADPMTGIAAKLEAQYPNHLVLLQAGTFLHGNCVQRLTPAAFRGYIPSKCLKSRVASGMSPRKSVTFFTPRAFAMGAVGQKHKTRKGNTARSSCYEISTLAPTFLLEIEEVDFSKSQQGAIMITTAQGTFVPAVFNFQSHAVRTVLHKGEPWFVAKDVCDVLDYDHVPHAMRVLDSDEKDVQKLDTLGGIQRLSIINESGLYALVMRSRKPEARKFAKWVTSEVLPEIRKTGRYEVAAPVPAKPKYMRSPRDIYTPEQIEQRINARAFELASMFRDKFVAEMHHENQFHYFLTGDNKVESWVPRFPSADVIAHLEIISGMAASLAEQAKQRDVSLTELLDAARRGGK